MKSPKTLYIHIGSHKTGSTSIQRALVEHKGYLAKNGITLFHDKPDGQPRNIGNVHPWMALNLDAWFVNEGASASVRQGLKPGFCDRIAVLPGDVLISCESFSYFFDQISLENFLAELKDHFDEIKVLVYLRRQDAHAVSHYQQGSKDFKTGAAKLYGTISKALPEYRSKLDMYLDYNQRLSMWGDQVGDQNMIIRVFDRKLLKNADVVDDFFDLLGLEKQIELAPENESLGFIRTKVGHLINQLRVPLSRTKHLREALDNSGKLLPSREQAERFYSHYRDSNKLLNQRFGINHLENVFSEDFTMYPEKAADDWDEDKANLAISEIIRSTGSIKNISHYDLDFLKDCVSTVNQSDKELARQLERFIVRMEKFSKREVIDQQLHKRLKKKLKKALKPHYIKLRYGLLRR